MKQVPVQQKKGSYLYLTNMKYCINIFHNNIWYLGGDDSVVSKALWYVVAMLGETICYINRPGVTLMRGVKALKG